MAGTMQAPSFPVVPGQEYSATATIPADRLAAARSFLLDPDTIHEAACPQCGGIVLITSGGVFRSGSGQGDPLGHEPVLGDLIDAASARKCTDGDDNA